MKTLTTFILGIILLFLSFFMISIGKEFKSFYDYLIFISGTIILIVGINKIDKSTD